jgi:hypothetical protein
MQLDLSISTSSLASFRNERLCPKNKNKKRKLENFPQARKSCTDRNPTKTTVLEEGPAFF